jgi:peptidoglycan hydrolase CwlO-like protein
VNRWKSHFQNAQRDLRRAQEELERAQDKNQQQHAVIKQLQADFNALKEMIRKEIYDLRDLVVDKNSGGS